MIVSGRDPESRGLVLRHFASITADNVIKAGFINLRPGEFNFGPADAFVAFGEAHGMFIVGHTLVWHNQTPAWFFQDESGKPNPPAAQIERMRSHIETVAGRYKRRVHAWDVVNEVIDNNGSYRPTSWVNAVGNGDELVKAAFRFASSPHPVPSSTTTTSTPGGQPSGTASCAWSRCSRRRASGSTGSGCRDRSPGRSCPCGWAFAALGVKVMITELDVDVLPLTREGQVIGTVMSDPQFQIEEFKAYLDPYRGGLPDDVERQVEDAEQIRPSRRRSGARTTVCHGRTTTRCQAG